jgi:UDP:flavonoid glycosyltransferase YjiC (YdhE family)
MAHDAEFFRVSAEVCRVSGRRGLLLTQFPEQVPARLPETVRHFHYVPFSEVLPRAAAFVHHGGIGTIAQGIAAGVPQLVVPLAHDQPDNAVRVRGLGFGDMLRPRQYQVKTVLQRLESMLGSAAIRENCRRRSRDLSAGSTLERTCELIEGLG